MCNKSHYSRHFASFFFLKSYVFDLFSRQFHHQWNVPWYSKFPLESYSTDEGAAVGAWVLLQTGQQEGMGRSGLALTPNVRNSGLQLSRERVGPRRVGLYLVYAECMAGLIELSLSYVWLRKCCLVFRRSSWWIHFAVASVVPTSFFALLSNGEVKRAVLVGCGWPVQCQRGRGSRGI